MNYNWNLESLGARNQNIKLVFYQIKLKNTGRNVNYSADRLDQNETAEKFDRLCHYSESEISRLM